MELTQEILEENGCTADVEGFNEHMLHQKEQARAARKSEEDEGWSDDASYSQDKNLQNLQDMMNYPQKL